MDGIGFAVIATINGLRSGPSVNFEEGRLILIPGFTRKVELTMKRRRNNRTRSINGTMKSR
jgi:hypothetical protein